MKHLLMLGSALLALCSIACKGQTRATTDQAALKVISYNVRYTGERSTDGQNHWDYRSHASINMVREERPTVMGTQEVLRSQLEFLSENLPEYGSVGVGRDDGAEAGEHMAIFYLKEEVELLDWGTFWLSESPDKVSMGWDAACNRTCTWAMMRHKPSGKRFALLNTHLDHRGKVAQREGLRLVAEHAKQMAERASTEGEPLPILLTGDFNTTTDSEIYGVLNDLMQDAREMAPQSDRRATFNGWGRGSSVIDHIFVRGAEVDRFEVLCDKNYGAPYISDHYPVAASVRF